MGKHATISPAEAADRLAIRELVEVVCSDEPVRVYLQQIMCSNRIRFVVKHETS
jgi:hypothetical protein